MRYRKHTAGCNSLRSVPLDRHLRLVASRHAEVIERAGSYLLPVGMYARCLASGTSAGRFSVSKGRVQNMCSSRQAEGGILQIHKV